MRGELVPKVAPKTPALIQLRNTIRQCKKKCKHLRKLERKVQGQSKTQNWYDMFAKRVLPSFVQVYETHVEVDRKMLVRSIVVGRQNEGGQNYPGGISAKAFEDIQKFGGKFGCQISISETLIKKSSTKSTKELQEAWFDVNVEAGKAALNNPAGASDLSLEKAKEEIKTKHDGIWDRSENTFQSMTIITLKGNEEDVLAAESFALSKLASKITGCFVPEALQLEAWLAGMAAPVADSRFYVEVDSSTASKLAAMSSINATYDPYGLYFGKNVETGADVIVNINQMQAKQAIWFGATGSGKTFSANVVLMRLKDMLGYRVVYISRKAPDRKEGAVSDYEAPAKFYQEEGDIIVMGEKGHSINPLQILYDEQTTTEGDFDIIWDAKRRITSTFFNLWFKNEFSSNMESMLEDALDEVYDKAGIYRDRPETWKRKSPTIGRDNCLRDIWWKYMQDKEGKMFEDRRAAGALYRKTRNTKPGGSMDYLNNDTSFDFGKEWLSISLHKVDKRLQDALYVLITSGLSMRFNTDSNKETVIFVDEARAFLRNPEISSFLLDTLTMGRSHGVSLWLATQQPADLIKAKVEEEFSTNVFISVAMGAKLKPKSARYVQEFFGLSDSTVNDLLTCQQGEGLLIIDDEITKVKFEPTELEKAVIGGTYIEEQIKNNPIAGYRIKEMFLEKGIDGKNFIERNKFFLKTMLEDPNDESSVLQDGWLKHNIPTLLGKRGSTNLYYRPGTLDLKKDLVTAPGYGSMTIDHMHVGLQYATYCMERGFKVSLNLNNYADLILEWKHSDGKIRVYAGEIEEKGSHTKEELNLKWGRLLKYDDYRFISQDPEFLVNAGIPEKYVIKRGDNFVKWIESIIDETNLSAADYDSEAENQEATEQNEPGIQSIKTTTVDPQLVLDFMESLDDEKRDIFKKIIGENKAINTDESDIGAM